MVKWSRNKKKSPRFLLILLLYLLILWCSLFLIKSIFKKIPPPKKILKPKLAIIIDDFGRNKKIAEQIYKIHSPITLSILPYLPYSSEIARTATANGYEVMLHLPMEPLNPKANPGKGAIYVRMSSKEIAFQTAENIINLPPLIKGVNNHMGSRATADRRVMKAMLQELKKYNFYYVDSVTSSHSIGFAVAKELEIKTAKRDIFLDNKNDADYIKGQLRKLMVKALKNKKAIGIGHTHPLTIEVIGEMIPEIEKKGIQIVFASEIVE